MSTIPRDMWAHVTRRGKIIACHEHRVTCIQPRKGDKYAKVRVIPIDDESVTRQLKSAMLAIKRRAHRSEGLSPCDNALIVMHSLGILVRINLRMSARRATKETTK